MREVLVCIDAPHFYAGLVAVDGKVVAAADIIRYMRGWDGKRVANYCRLKGWKCQRIATTDDGP